MPRIDQVLFLWDPGSKLVDSNPVLCGCLSSETARGLKVSDVRLAPWTGSASCTRNTCSMSAIHMSQRVHSL